MRRCCVLGRKAVASAYDKRLDIGILESLNYIQIKRIAVGTWLLGPVKHADALYALRAYSHKVLYRERPVQMNCDKASLLSIGVKLVHSGLDNVGNRAHGYDDILCIACAVVAERSIAASSDLAYSLHIVGYNVWNCVVIFILCLAGLEIDVRVLCCTTGDRMLRIKGFVAEPLKGIPVNQRTQEFHVHLLYLLDLV